MAPAPTPPATRRLATVPLFFDKSIGVRVPRALQQVGADVTIYVDEYGHVRREYSDAPWIQDQTVMGRVLVTKDKGISYKPLEKGEIVASSARVYMIGGGLRAFHMLRCLMAAWQRIERQLATTPGPFITRVYADGQIRRLRI